MKTKQDFPVSPKFPLFSTTGIIAVTLLFGTLAASAQTGDYLYNGSEQTITLNPGSYYITAYGAQGGNSYFQLLNGTTYGASGGLGAEMSAEFSFSEPTMLTLLVGGSGSSPIGSGGGGGGSFVVNGNTPLVVAGGGGGAGLDENGPDVSGGIGQVSTSGGSVNAQGGGTGGISGNGGAGGNVGVFQPQQGGGGGGGFSGSGIGGGGIGASGPLGGVGGASYLAGGQGGNGVMGGGGYGGGGGGGFFAQAGPGGMGLSGWGGGGGGGGYSGGGGGGGYQYLYGGGGGGSIIDSSAIAILTEVSGAASPDGSPNGEIIITTVPEPTTLTLVGLSMLSLLLFRR